MNEKEEPMNMNVTPPVEPVTEFEVHLPPDRKHPKWLVPLIAGGYCRRCFGGCRHRWIPVLEP